MLRGTSAIVGMALVVGVLTSGVAGAQEDARTLFQRGQVAYTQGDYEASVEAWTRAYELDPRPLLQFNLSQALERLGRLGEAVEALEVYLAASPPDDPSTANARARLAALRMRLNETGIQLTGGPAGATILLDGEDVGRTPRPDVIRVSPGSHRVVVRLEGYEDFTASVVVPAGQAAPVEVSMAAGASGGTGGGPPILPIVFFSAAGVTGITGAVLGAVALSDAGNAPGSTSAEADSARTLALVADISLGVSAACAAAAVIFLVLDATGSGDDTALRVAPWANLDGGGFLLESSF